MSAWKAEVARRGLLPRRLTDLRPRTAGAEAATPARRKRRRLLSPTSMAKRLRGNPLVVASLEDAVGILIQEEIGAAY